MIKIIASGLFCFCALLLIGAALWSRSSPPLSEENEKIIQSLMSSPIPNMLEGESGFAQSGALRIWYTVKHPSAKSGQRPRGAVLLINGLGASAAFWPAEIYQPLLEAGYQVILSDHRGVGESDRVENWSKSNSYDLGDMANDNLAVLDTLGIKKAHVLGLSLGGMIGQEMAIHHPERVLSLSSVMSTAYLEDPAIPVSRDFQINTMKLFLRYGLFNSEENMVRLMVGLYSYLKGDQDIDIRHIGLATRFELSQRRGFNHSLPDQQSTAIARSGSRLAQLPKLTVPVLAVHGDSDPLLNIEHARKYATLIPRHESLWLEGMGHDLAPAYVSRWIARAVQFMDAHQ